MTIRKVLVVDDEPLMRDFVGETLLRMGCEVKFASEGLAAIRLLENENFDLVFSDMKLPKLSGLEVLKSAKELSPKTEVVIMTAYGTIETAIEAMKSGASDYLLKPFTPEQVELLVEKISSSVSLKAENEYLRREVNENYGFGEIIGQSEPLQDVYTIIKKVAESKASVLISGETGTGKELIARAIHYNSDRKNKPFIKFNCAALPENLIESELFGHEKGAFTGANILRQGRFELADGGTIFLDEISEIDISLQPKLLRVLQEREFERVGSARSIKVDVRILASTNRDLKAEIEKGAFREDLYYRLNVVPVHLPPLRERKGDVLLLAEKFLKRFSQENKKQAKSFTKEALDLLEKYPWPGNVRELENVIERSVVMDRSNIIEPKDLGISLESSDSFMPQAKTDKPTGQTLAEMEKDLIVSTLNHYQGNRTKTADVLGISIRTLRNKLHEYNLMS